MKKKILDVMIDFETFGRQPDSVPINLAVVAWNRYAEENPFIIPGVGFGGLTTNWAMAEANLPFFVTMPMSKPSLFDSRFAIWHFDVCACLIEGMTIEGETQQWWMEQPVTAGSSLLLEDRKQYRPYDVIAFFVKWLSDLKEETKADKICIWSQGSDFDIAKLRWLLNKYPRCIERTEGASMLLHHTLFRDARTVILEIGNKLFDGKRGFSVDLATGTIITDGKPNVNDELCDFSSVYDKIISMEAWAKQLQLKDGIATGVEGIMSDYLFHLALSPHAHNSIYDCMRSIYNVWWLNKALDTQMI